VEGRGGERIDRATTDTPSFTCARCCRPTAAGGCRALDGTALATVRRDIGLLVAEADEVLKGVGGVESASTAQPQTHLPFLPTAPLEAALYNAKKSLLR